MYKSLKSNRDRWRNVAVQKENVAKKIYFFTVCLKEFQRYVFRFDTVSAGDER